MVHLTLTARHLELTEALRTYVEERVRRIERYTVKPVSAIVTLMIEKYRHIVDISLNIHGAIVQAKGESREMYSSIDKAVEKIERQMKKYKTKANRKKAHFEMVESERAPETSDREVSGTNDWMQKGTALDILMEAGSEDNKSEGRGTPKTPWALGPIEPLC